MRVFIWNVHLYVKFSELDGQVEKQTYLYGY